MTEKEYPVGQTVIIPPAISVNENGKPAFTVRKDIETYINITRKAWGRRPHFYRIHINLYSHRLKSLKQSFLEITGYIWSSFTRSSPNITAPACDILLYYSSSKSLFQEAIDKLCLELAKQGFRCGLLATNQLYIYQQDNNGKIVIEQVPDIESFLIHGSSRWNAFKHLVNSIWNTIVLYGYLSKAQLLQEYHNPLEVMNTIHSDFHNFDVAECLLSQIKPRMILSNHALLGFAGAMMATPTARNAIRVWFCNEHPGTFHLAQDVCDELWCWNQLHIDTYKMMGQPDVHLRYIIVGHSETDAVLSKENTPNKTAEGQKIEEIIRGKKAVLYLSNYIPSNNGLQVKPDEVFIDLCDMLAKVSRKFPDWYFIYKARPRRIEETPPGLEKLAELPNWLIPSTEINLADFLHLDQIKIVAAEASVGLLAAAGVYKLPVRLISEYRKDYVFSNVEQISLPVHSNDEFEFVLDHYDQIASQYQNWLNENVEQVFPYRGRVIQRMLGLCNDYLSKP